MFRARLAIWNRDYIGNRIRPPILFCILSDPRCHPVDPIYRVCRLGSTALARHLWTPCRGICRWLAASSPPRISILVRIYTLPYSPAIVWIYRVKARARACMHTRASLIGTAVVKHFDFVRFVAIWHLICARRFSRMILTWAVRELRRTYNIRNAKCLSEEYFQMMENNTRNIIRSVIIILVHKI